MAVKEVLVMEKVIRKMEADIPSLPLRKRGRGLCPRVQRQGCDAALPVPRRSATTANTSRVTPEWEYAGVYVDEALTRHEG